MTAELFGGKADAEAFGSCSTNMNLKFKQQIEILRLKSFYPGTLGPKIWPDTRNRCLCYDGIPLAEWIGENKHDTGLTILMVAPLWLAVTVIVWNTKSVRSGINGSNDTPRQVCNVSVCQYSGLLPYCITVTGAHL